MVGYFASGFGLSSDMGKNVGKQLAHLHVVDRPNPPSLLAFTHTVLLNLALLLLGVSTVRLEEKSKSDIEQK